MPAAPLNPEPPRILVVEDDFGIATLLEELIADQGGSSVVVTNAAAAMAQLRRWTPTLMLLDYSLPDMDGSSLLDRLREQDLPVPPFIATTGAGDEQIAVRLMKQGAMDYLVKDGRFLDSVGTTIRQVLGELDIARRLATAEREVGRQLDRYHAILDTTPDGFAIVGDDLRFVDVNSAYCRMMGYRREELIGESIGKVKPEDKRQETSRLIEHIRRDGPQRIETVNLTRDGKRLDVELSISYHPDHGTLSFVRDISERKRIAAELDRHRHDLERLVAERTAELEEAKRRIEAAELKYRTVADHTYDWETWIDPEGRYIYCSPACERISGYPAADFLQAPALFTEIVHPEDRQAVTEHLHTHRCDSGLHTLEFRIRHRDGEYRWIEHRCLPIHDDQHRFLGRRASNRDITDRKRSDEELHRARDAAEAANRAKSIFLANMSHELRTPLNAILGFAQIMQRDDAIAPIHQQELETINRAGHHLLMLINDVLDISRIEAGRIQIKRHPFEFRELLTTIEEMIRIRAEAKGLTLTVAPTGELPRFVEGDAHHLQQVLINLLGNAVKYSDEGSIVLRILPRAEAIRFEVADNGPGIAMKEQEQIFQAFYQTAEGIAKGEGAGLGLTISRELVRLMGGELTLASTPGVGSTFAFDLPLPTCDAPVDSARRGHVVGLADGEPAYRVLVAEDHPDNQELISRLLATVGFEVRTAENGERAVALFQYWCPHFIWMDMRMPGMDGYEATRRIRTLPGGDDVKIAALTASVFEEERGAILAAGCDDMVRKPIEEGVLFDTMARLLGVSFRYAEEPPERLHAAAPSALDLSPIPRAELAALHQAAITLDSEDAQAVIAVIAAHHPAQAQALAELIAGFRFDQVAALCEAAADDSLP